MKITFLLPTIGLSGGVKIVFKYANNLVDRGHEVEVVYPKLLASQLLLTLDPKYFQFKSFIFQIIKTIKFFPKAKLFENKDIIELKAKLVEVPTLDERYIHDSDIIIATWWETALYLNKYSKNKGKKFYLMQHYEVWGGPEELVKSTYKLNFKKIVIAKWLYKRLLELHIPKDQLSYVPNAIDFTDFKLIEKLELRKPIVSMQYNEAVYKGMDDGIEALELVKKEFDQLKVILFGFNPRPKNLPKWMEYVENPSRRYLVHEIYNKSAIYLCPSLSEGWHLPPAEAMACGCAVVSTDIGGVKDYAINNETTLLSPVKDPQSLADNILKLLNNSEYRIELAYAGYKNIKKFNWDKSTSQLENLFFEE